MLTLLRLTWRMQRWEIAFLIGVPLLLAAAAGLVAWQTTITQTSLAPCYAAAGVPSASCRSLIDWSNFLAQVSPTLEGTATVVPLLAGVLLGAPLVAREIEKRTASLAWSLSRSRARWLAGRTLPLVVALAIALLLLGQATEALIRATPPGTVGFPYFAMHGPLVAVRGIAALGIGVLVGLLMGRVLPSILVTGLLVIALLVGLQLWRDQMMQAEAVWVVADAADLSGVMVYDSGFIDDATGELVSFDQAYARYPDVFGPQGSGMPPGMTLVYRTASPERYPVFVAREEAALLGVVVLAGAAALLVIGWRRPGVG